jgi:hypothetical protein
MLRVSTASAVWNHGLTDRHIHVSIRDESGRNIFAVTEEERKAGGRKDAAFDDTKYLSQEAEWFLAGLLAGLSDGKLSWSVVYQRSADSQSFP